MNNTNATDSLNNSHHKEIQVTVWTIVQLVAYYVMILLSLIGNIVVIKTIKRMGRPLRRQVYYFFIVNLSVADLLFAVENVPMACTHLLLNGVWKVPLQVWYVSLRNIHLDLEPDHFSHCSGEVLWDFFSTEKLRFNETGVFHTHVHVAHWLFLFYSIVFLCFSGKITRWQFQMLYLHF